MMTDVLKAGLYEDLVFFLTQMNDNSRPPDNETPPSRGGIYGVQPLLSLKALKSRLSIGLLFTPVPF